MSTSLDCLAGRLTASSAGGDNSSLQRSSGAEFEVVLAGCRKEATEPQATAHPLLGWLTDLEQQQDQIQQQMNYLNTLNVNSPEYQQGLIGLLNQAYLFQQQLEMMSSTVREVGAGVRRVFELQV